MRAQAVVLCTSTVRLQITPGAQLARCHNLAVCLQVRREIVSAKGSTGGDFTRRDVVVAGAIGAAGSKLASSAAPAIAAQGQVTPVNIDAKETMQLGKSGVVPAHQVSAQLNSQSSASSSDRSG